MLKDITLGQYYRADSVIHRLDPRTKIVGTLVYMISLFLFNNLICYVFAAVFLTFIIGLSKVPLEIHVARNEVRVVFAGLYRNLQHLFRHGDRDRGILGVYDYL